jgi:hypothetical protein
MGQTNSELNGIDKNTKGSNKGNFIDELIGADDNYTSAVNKNNKKHSKLNKTDNNQSTNMVPTSAGGNTPTISKSPASNEMIVRKKLITTTTTSSSTTNLANLQQELGQQPLQPNNKTNRAEQKAVSSIQKEQLEYEFHIEPPVKKKTNNPAKKRKKNRKNHNGNCNNLLSNIFRMNANNSPNAPNNGVLAEIDSNDELEAKSNALCCLSSKSHVMSDRHDSILRTLSKNSLRNTIGTKANRSPSGKSKKTVNQDEYDDEYYMEPPPVTCIRVLRPSNDLSAVRFDSHYNIIDIKNKNDDSKNDLTV